MIWYNWVALAVLIACVFVYNLLSPFQEEGRLGVLAAQVVSIHVGILCVFMFIFQGLDWLEAATR